MEPRADLLEFLDYLQECMEEQGIVLALGGPRDGLPTKLADLYRRWLLDPEYSRAPSTPTTWDDVGAIFCGRGPT